MKKPLFPTLVGISFLVLSIAGFHREYTRKKPDAKTSQLEPGLAEALSPEAIIHTHQIVIPGHSRAFNPSLIPFEEGYLLSFCYKTKLAVEKGVRQKRKRGDLKGLVRLDLDFNVDPTSVQELDIYSYSDKISSTAKDIRLFTIKNRIYIFFNDIPLTEEHAEAFHKAHGYYQSAMYVGELVQNNGHFELKEPAKKLHYLHQTETERNWTPFLINDKVYFIYADKPRIVLELNLDTGECLETAKAIMPTLWNWGEIRGGTPAYFLDGKFLTFFHSSISVKATESNRLKRRNYVMGAYLFDPNPPFNVNTMTKMPLGDVKNYTENNYRTVMFPGGLVINDRGIHVAWGKNDNQVFVSTFNKEKLLESMVASPSEPR